MARWLEYRYNDRSSCFLIPNPKNNVGYIGRNSDNDVPIIQGLYGLEKDIISTIARLHLVYSLDKENDCLIVTNVPKKTLTFLDGEKLKPSDQFHLSLVQGGNTTHRLGKVLFHYEEIPSISDSDFQRKIEKMKYEISGKKVSTTKKGNT